MILFRCGFVCESPTKSTTKQIPDCFAAGLFSKSGVRSFARAYALIFNTRDTEGHVFRAEPGDPRTTFTAVLGNASQLCIDSVIDAHSRLVEFSCSGMSSDFDVYQ